MVKLFTPAINAIWPPSVGFSSLKSYLHFHSRLPSRFNAEIRFEEPDSAFWTARQRALFFLAGVIGLILGQSFAFGQTSEDWERLRKGNPDLFLACYKQQPVRWAQARSPLKEHSQIVLGACRQGREPLARAIAGELAARGDTTQTAGKRAADLVADIPVGTIETYQKMRAVRREQ